MKKGTKFSIFLLAILITFVWFNLMSSSYTVHMIKLGKDARFHIISNHLAIKAKATSLDQQ